MTCSPDCDQRTDCSIVGEIGHFQCGVCPDHHQPRHHCGCTVTEVAPVGPVRSDIGLTEMHSRVQEALSRLESEARGCFRSSARGQLIEALGCILTGRKGSWWP